MLLPSSIQVNKLFHLTGHAAGIFAIERGPAENLFFTGGGDGLIAQWNLEDPKHAKGMARIPGNIFAMLFIPEEEMIIAGDLNGGIHLIDLVSKTEIFRFSCDGSTVYDIKKYSADSVLFACANGSVYVFDFKLRLLKEKISVSTASIRHINRGSLIIFSSSDHCLYVYKNDLTFLKILEGHSNSVFCSVFTEHERLLISGSRDAQLRVWDADNDFSPVQTIPAHMFTINDIKISPDSRIFATAGRDKHIKIWDAEHFNLLKVIDAEKFGGHINSVNKLFWSNWNNCLISCGDDRSVMVWQIDIIT